MMVLQHMCENIDIIELTYTGMRNLDLDMMVLLHMCKNMDIVEL